MAVDRVGFYWIDHCYALTSVPRVHVCQRECVSGRSSAAAWLLCYSRLRSGVPAQYLSTLAFTR